MTVKQNVLKVSMQLNYILTTKKLIKELFNLPSIVFCKQLCVTEVPRKENLSIVPFISSLYNKGARNTFSSFHFESKTNINHFKVLFTGITKNVYVNDTSMTIPISFTKGQILKLFLIYVTIISKYTKKRFTGRVLAEKAVQKFKNNETDSFEPSKDILKLGFVESRKTLNCDCFSKSTEKFRYWVTLESSRVYVSVSEL
ncbi:hypothetical protein L596_015991 [Steinernema carpocapsae]|uniref:Uncharacterized protein n=1 Tax=Steinernema carpocapsae TaxID=34508 RepID=A0A4U5NHM0_STECR|nr:hypothetical protein L596_015991 [Steinernema carpocapsae]